MSSTARFLAAIASRARSTRDICDLDLTRWRTWIVCHSDLMAQPKIVDCLIFFRARCYCTNCIDLRGWVFCYLRYCLCKTTDTDIDQLTFRALILTMRFHALPVSCAWLERLTCPFWMYWGLETARCVLSTESPRWQNGMTLFDDHYFEPRVISILNLPDG